MAVGLLLLLAAPAWSAQVVDVRIGHHPSFTRVVFELDSPAGYRVERHAPIPGIGELVITLEASSPAAKNLDPRDKSLVEGVEVVAEGTRSVAHIRLARDGLKLKEMILANPPRIVLDVLGEKPPSRAAPAVAETESKAGSQKVAKAEPQKPAAVPKPVTASTPQRPESQPTATAEAPRSQTRPAPSGSTAPASPGATQPTSPGGAKSGQLSLSPPPPGVAPSRSAPAPATSRPAPKPASPARTTAAVPRPDRPSAQPKPRARTQPAAVPPPPAESFFTGTTGMAIGAIVLLVAGAGGLMWWRRSSAVDDDEDFGETPIGDEDPFADLQAAPGDDRTDNEEFALSGGGDGVDTATLDAAEGAESTQAPEISADSELQEGTDMDEQVVVADNASTVILDSQPIGQVGAMDAAGAAPDVTRMLREFERRIASLETRLDEAVDARERLERQVAAQTEELRVQRAAIARTQRAVRNMTRPEEDTAPTEPALRDPARPDGPRD